MSNVVGPPSLEPWFSTNARSIEPACSNERPRFGNEWGDMCNEDEIDIINVNNKGTCRYITAVLTTTIVRYFAIYTCTCKCNIADCRWRGRFRVFASRQGFPRHFGGTLNFHRAAARAIDGRANNTNKRAAAGEKESQSQIAQ